MRRIFFFFSLVLAIQAQPFSVDSIRSIPFDKNQLAAASHHLNAAMFVLLETGMAPDYADQMLQNLKWIDLVGKNDQLRAFILLSLPLSLRKKEQLTSAQKHLKKRIAGTVFVAAQLALLDPPFKTNISTDVQFRQATMSLQRAIQVMALAVFNLQGLSEQENAFFLKHVDRLVYFFGEWKNSDQNASDLNTFIDNIEPHANAINQFFTEVVKTATVEGHHAILLSMWQHLKSFFTYRKISWAQSMP
jgi:hypothetical protein